MPANTRKHSTVRCFTCGFHCESPTANVQFCAHQRDTGGTRGTLSEPGPFKPRRDYRLLNHLFHWYMGCCICNWRSNYIVKPRRALFARVSSFAFVGWAATIIHYNWKSCDLLLHGSRRDSRVKWLYDLGGIVSWIHRLGLFVTVTGLPSTNFPSLSLSAYRVLLGRAGHGSILEADTVKTVAKNVIPNSEDTKVRRCVNRMALFTDIL